MQSEEINELAAALVAFQGEMGAVPKGSVNPFFKSRYADLADVKKEASPVAWKHGLAVTQFVHQNELGEDCLKTYLIHSSGQFIEHSMKLYLTKLDSQGMGSATTYARRYSYMSVLGLVADEDDDANKASNNEPGEYRNGEKTRDFTPIPGRGYIEGSGNPNFDMILKASTQSDSDFLGSLASQIETRGTLTAGQIDSGVKAAKKILGLA